MNEISLSEIRKSLKLWINREHCQAKRLVSALDVNFKNTINHTFRMKRNISRQAMWNFGALNPHARCLYMEALARHLFARLGSTTPKWQSQLPVYFVTIVNRDHLLLSKYDVDFLKDENPRNPLFPYSRERIIRNASSSSQRHLWRFNYVGMLDASFYGSSVPFIHYKHVANLHTHALVWNARESELAECRSAVNRSTRALMPYGEAMQYQAINPADLRQIFWYTHKTPYKFYQLSRRKVSDRPFQNKRQLSGVNALRLADLLSGVSLTDLIVSGGEGSDLVARALADIDQRDPHLRRRG